MPQVTLTTQMYVRNHFLTQRSLAIATLFQCGCLSDHRRFLPIVSKCVGVDFYVFFLAIAQFLACMVSRMTDNLRLLMAKNIVALSGCVVYLIRCCGRSVERILVKFPINLFLV